jgi:hypothetical protein
MAKRQVVEIKCSRCDRTEYREAVDEESAKEAFSAILRIGVDTLDVSFDDLCDPCANTVRGHLSAIAKKIEGLSPARQKKEKTAPVLKAVPAKEHPHARSSG